MVLALNETPFEWEGLELRAVRVSDEFIVGGIPLHRHAADSMELHAILAGKGTVRTPQGIFAVAEGDFFVTAGDAEHEQLSDLHDPMRELCIYAAFRRIAKPGPTAKVILKKEIFFGKADESFRAVAETFKNELSRHMPGYEYAAECLSRLLIIFAARSAASDGTGKPEIKADNGGSIFLKIEEAFLYDYRTITLPALAKRAGLSERQTQRLLLSHYGSTFTALRTRARMQAANLLLSEGKFSITRIAEETGYSCAEHFCAEYKKFNGFTAGEYRKRFCGVPPHTYGA